MDGISVKAIWMRKDDIQHGYCHIVSAERLGRQPRQQQQAGGLAASDDRVGSGMGFVDVPFDIPNLRCENGEAEAHTSIG